MRDLQEQVRDLMFYVETQKKISESPESTRQVSPREYFGVFKINHSCQCASRDKFHASLNFEFVGFSTWGYTNPVIATKPCGMQINDVAAMYCNCVYKTLVWACLSAWFQRSNSPTPETLIYTCGCPLDC